MKKIYSVLLILAVLLLAVLSGCPAYDSADFADSADSSFYDVSAPYLEQYGQPEDVYEYQSSSAYLIDWWWWSQGFMVTFSNWNAGATKESNGWQVESIYTFPPI